jgi:hypothetical protein
VRRIEIQQELTFNFLCPVCQWWKGKNKIVRTCRKNVRRKMKMFKNIQEGEKSVGMTRNRWLDDAVNSVKKIGVTSWR